MTAKKSKTQVTLSVADAGDPVGGATISFAGKTLKTSAAGKATAPLPSGKATAKASKPGYQPASVSVSG